ncbi:MAG: hypothetical protein JRI72_16375 [Deltaproteobacteria bacterium]|nr:hypothetical protein [Deltaproteobacteria bacterium]
MKKEITWTLKTGKKAKVTVELSTGKTVDADGIKIAVKDCTMTLTAEVEGMGIVGMGNIHKVAGNNKDIVARIGKLGINQSNLDKINAAITDLEATPEWQTKMKQEDKAIQDGIDYEIHRVKMEKVMGY